MKKYKLFLVGALLCGSTYAGYSAYQNATLTEYEKMITANLEALTSGEGSSTSWSCGGWSNNACRAKCGSCGTEVVGEGKLKGSHQCW